MAAGAREDKVPIHEGIHYLQQVRDGTLIFYRNTIDDYLSYRDGYVYGMIGSMEYEADDYAKIRHPNNKGEGYMDHPGY